MLRNDGTPIIFAQWDLVSGNKMKRRDYRLDQMMRGTEEQTFMEMFLDDWEFDEETNAWIGTIVENTKYGEGKVTGFKPGKILVSFSQDLKMFLMPSAFEKGHLKVKEW